MRCKNCGSENNDNLYICQNCGSPLYDETEPIGSDGGTTNVFTPPVTPSGENSYNQYIDNFNNQQRRPREERPMASVPPAKDDSAKKRQIAIIVILSVVLVAIIVGIIVAVAHSKRDDNTTTLPSSSVSQSESSTLTTQSTTDESTTESTTSTTTTTTTTTTTKTTTKAQKYNISVGTNNLGSAEGGGTYKKGEKIELWCSADDGTKFVGWYKNGSKYSTKERITLTVEEDAYFEARFEKIETPDSSDNIDSDTDEEAL